MSIQPQASNVYTVVTPFGGCGGGAYGAQKAHTKFRGLSGSVKLLGGYDYDQYACDAFKYLTGVHEHCCDARALTPEDIHAMWGKTAPWSIVSSPPCVGATSLISHEKASTDHYREMNSLMLPSTRTILEAYGPDPENLPAFWIFENVPGLASDKRGGRMLRDLFALFKSYGCYAIHVGTHNARHVGGGAQNRVRLLIIVRNTKRVPVFLYKPPHQDGSVIADVLGGLPLPDDPRGGPMHTTTRRMSFLNRLRLWAIPAGKDWRALRDRRDQLAMKVAEGAHANLYRVADDGDAAPVVTCASRPGGGALSVADHRTPIDLTPQASNANLHANKYTMVPWNGVAKAIVTATRVGSGAQGVAQPVDLTTEAFRGSYGVLATSDAAPTVKANSFPTTGPYSLAAPVPDPINLVPMKECQPSCYGVLDKHHQSRTVKSTSNSVGNGAYAIADDVPRQPLDLALSCECRAGSYGVQGFTDPSKTVIAWARVDNSPGAVADPRNGEPRYVILTCDQVEQIVSGVVPVPFAIVDPEAPAVPLAIVDDLRKPAWRPRLETVPAKGKQPATTKTVREPVTVVLISPDGTWHRELTTLELAALQHFPTQHNGAPLDFGGSTTNQRKIVGNAIPSGVMEAVFGQILTSSLASAQAFFLSPSNWDVWVQGLRDDGYEVADASRPHHIGGGVVLHDGALAAPRRRRRKTKKAKLARRPLTKKISQNHAAHAPIQ